MINSDDTQTVDWVGDSLLMTIDFISWTAVRALRQAAGESRGLFGKSNNENIIP